MLLIAQNQQDDFLSDKEMSFQTDPARELVDIFLSNFFDTIVLDCNNTTAIEIFEQRIDTLKSYTNKNRENIFGNIAYFVVNFVLLTGIETELAGNFTGYYNPTNTDLEKWKEWLQKHKDYLCWYKEKNILYIRERAQQTR